MSQVKNGTPKAMLIDSMKIVGQQLHGGYHLIVFTMNFNYFPRSR